MEDFRFMLVTAVHAAAFYMFSAGSIFSLIIFTPVRIMMHNHIVLCMYNIIKMKSLSKEQKY